MADMLRTAVLAVANLGYRYGLRRAFFRKPAQPAHEEVLKLLTRLDDDLVNLQRLQRLHKITFGARPVIAGGVSLPFPLMLAAGFVKGQGFYDEARAFEAVESGANIMPGWRSMPLLVGPVEYGSFTRYPRLGNPGTVLWRDAKTGSTQNRIGLKNPGAKAAAAFLRDKPMPPGYGINIAVSPGVDDPAQQRDEVAEAVQSFIDAGLRPNWFTLNVSCPNTEDDPQGHQTERETSALCRAVIDQIGQIPLWVKVGPDLAESQYRLLMGVFAEAGVQAVIATNTLGQPSPIDPTMTAGVGGGRLHMRAVQVAALLVEEKAARGYSIDVIGCGGVYNPPTYFEFAVQGVPVVQYWSGLIYGGPLMAASIIDVL